jgi:hypothetical protein
MTNGYPAIDDDSGTGKASFISADSYKQTGIVYIGLKPFLRGNRKVDLYRNDSWNDHDGDRLGALLEYELKLCDNKDFVFDGFNCSSVYNTRDTDGDGIEDYVEVFGCDRGCRSGNNIYPGCYGAEYTNSACGSGRVLYKNTDFPQYLPAWGADPRRKDLFVEVDRHILTDVPPGQYNKYDSYFKLREEDTDKFSKKYLDIRSNIRNPDGSVGVFVHFDIGESCLNDKICGNYGGSNKIPNRCDSFLVFNTGTSYFAKACEEEEYVGIFKCSDDLNKCENDERYFYKIRRGIFHYLLLLSPEVRERGYGTSGGSASCPGSYSEIVGNYIPYSQDVVTKYFSTLLHEVTHNFGIEDSGGSVEFGQHQYKPNYPSFMNYAFQGAFMGSEDNIQLSEGKNITLNPSKLCEKYGLGKDGNGASINPQYLGYSPFYYYCEGSEWDGEKYSGCKDVNGDNFISIDFNKDGYINYNDCNDKSNTVKYCIHCLGSSYYSTGLRHNTNYWIGEKDIESNVVVQDFYEMSGDRKKSLYLFYIKDKKLHYNKLKSFICNENYIYLPCDEWESYGPVSELLIDESSVNISTEEFKVGNENRLYIVYKGKEEVKDDKLYNIYILYYSENSGWNNSEILILDNAYTIYAPIIKKYKDKLFLFYVAPNNSIYYITMDSNGNWSTPLKVYDDNGNEILARTSVAAAIRPLFKFFIDKSILHILYGDEFGILTMRYLDEDGVWRKGFKYDEQDYNDEPFDFQISVTEGKMISFDWFNEGPNNGRFYSIIERYYYDSPSEVQFLSMIKGPKYNNKWIFEIIGVEMLESFNGVSIRNVDTSLIKGMVAAFLSMNGYIVFYPYANGVYDYDLKDVPDWKFVNDYLCISLHLDMPDKTGDYREYCGNYGEIKIKVMRDEKN